MCPYDDDSGWVNNVTLWPDVTYPDIYHYLIESPGVHTCDSMKNYKSLDSYIYFDGGKVRTVVCKRKGSRTLFKTQVGHGQKNTDPPCEVWVAVKKDGSVITANCDCKAG